MAVPTEPLEKRGALAMYVGCMKDKRTTLPLLDLLRDEQGDPELRSLAARALGETGDRRAIPRLIDVLLGDTQASVRQAAASSLGFIQADLVMEPLGTGLFDPNMLVRQSCASSLFSLAMHGQADPRTVPALEEVANHDDGQVYGHFPAREAATRALRAINRVLSERG